jgi:hypothetical protein
LRVLSHQGDFAGEALSADSESQVLLAALAKPASTRKR